MKAFYSFSASLKQMLPVIVGSCELHAKWLNTLSYLENCGARKIAACEHPTLVKEEMLKHASEEFRHAHYLKRQIERLSSLPLDDYSTNHLLGGTASLRYLDALDLHAYRYLSREVGLSKSVIKAISYLLVTYAIELRAEELYTLYEAVLRSFQSKVVVKSILLEENEHLSEMKKGIGLLPSGEVHAQKICALEGKLCSRWLKAVEKSIQSIKN